MPAVRQEKEPQFYRQLKFFLADQAEADVWHSKMAGRVTKETLQHLAGRAAQRILKEAPRHSRKAEFFIWQPKAMPQYRAVTVFGNQRHGGVVAEIAFGYPKIFIN